MLTNGRPSPLDKHVTDPAGLPPLCAAAEFPALLSQLAADAAPRVFAVVQEYGTRADVRCAAWGLSWDDRTDVLGAGGTLYLGARSPEYALRRFRFGTHITPHLVWL